MKREQRVREIEIRKNSVQEQLTKMKFFFEVFTLKLAVLHRQRFT